MEPVSWVQEHKKKKKNERPIPVAWNSTAITPHQRDTRREIDGEREKVINIHWLIVNGHQNQVNFSIFCWWCINYANKILGALFFFIPLIFFSIFVLFFWFEKKNPFSVCRLVLLQFFCFFFLVSEYVIFLLLESLHHRSKTICIVRKMLVRCKRKNSYN